MNEQDIPIDIAVRKLLDWLISRRICTRDWPEKVEKVRTKIREALLDMPEHPDMKELLLSSHLNYFTCLRIVDILKETEKDTKNFFGSYGSQRMKDWKEILGDYLSDNIYLAEVAQTLIQNVVYEIPGIKKHNLKLENEQAECVKKQENARKRILELEQEYRKQCQQLGIEGVKIKSEIMSLARDLPASYLDITQEAMSLKEAVQVYQDFVQASQDEGVEIKVVENLKFLIEEGNVTTYQWKYGEKPVSVEEPSWDFQDEDENEESSEIDFGDDAGGIDFGGDDGGIDFGDDAGGEIDFGDGEIDFGDSGAEIDFGDEASSGAILSLDDVDTSAIVVEEGGIQGGVARDQEALTLLDNRRTRAVIIDELEELSAFLTQRLAETNSSSTKFNIVAGASYSQAQDAVTLQKLLASVEAVLGKLTELKMQQLQMIRDSPSYADRLADTFKQKLKLKEKVVASIENLKQRAEEADNERTKGIHQVKRIQSQVQDWRSELEKDISKRYKGRKVTVSGV